MWKNMVHPGRAQMAIWRIACWIHKATNTHSGQYYLFLSHYNNGLRKRLSVRLYVRCCLGTYTQLLHSRAQQYLYSTTMNVHMPFNFRARIMQIFASKQFVERRYLLHYALNMCTMLYDTAICISSIQIFHCVHYLSAGLRISQLYQGLLSSVFHLVS